MDEAQQLALLFCQHLRSPAVLPRLAIEAAGQIAIVAKTNREQSLIVHALFGKRKVMSSGKADGDDHCPRTSLFVKVGAGWVILRDDRFAGSAGPAAPVQRPHATESSRTTSRLSSSNSLARAEARSKAALAPLRGPSSAGGNKRVSTPEILRHPKSARAPNSTPSSKLECARWASLVLRSRPASRAAGSLLRHGDRGLIGRGGYRIVRGAQLRGAADPL